MINIYEKDGYLIKEYQNGTIIKSKVLDESTIENVEIKTLDQELQELNNQNLILMDAIATLYEEIQALKGV